MNSSPPPPESTVDGGGSHSSFSGQKLRLMCSYGGQIIPRPLDKALCYAGGETRIVSIDRRSALSLSSLTSHISKSLFNGRPFVLKYQLPDHDLDSLVSISTDEDLANMIDEYDRVSSSSSPTPSRLRFFLFPLRSDELHDLKTEDWFGDALSNAGNKGGGDSGTWSPESIVLEKTSSFESTSSSTSAMNSPAIQRGGKEEGLGVHLRDIKVALPSLDSLGSDSSLPSPNFIQQANVYHDASGLVDSKPVSGNLVETESNVSDRSSRNDILTPIQVPGYIMPKPMDQPQHQAPTTLPSPTTPTPHYTHHPAPQSSYVTQYHPSSVPIASYPTTYPPYLQPQQPVQYQLNKPHPVYMMPIGPTQSPYDMSMPCSLVRARTVAPSPSQVPSNPVVVASPMVYGGYKPAAPVPDYAATKVLRATTVAAQPVTLPSNDHHHQVVAFPPMNPPSLPVAVPPPENTNHVSEYEDLMHAQIYKTQPLGPTLPSQLPAAINAATVMLPDSFSQLQVENTKHQGNS